ncbi:MAG: N-methylhydantoinase B [Gammaproteobacteria bacterium]|jgi:N-methylhydantoinase B
MNERKPTLPNNPAQGDLAAPDKSAPAGPGAGVDFAQRSVADPVQVEVFNQRLLAITEEMGAQLVRASFSPNIKERRDCSVALFDIDGHVIAQAAHIPIHLGSLLGGVAAMLRAFPSDTLRPGDAFVCNDAYLAGGTHLPDISVLTPVFWKGVPRFVVGCVGHHADVGGAVPGSISPNAASIFEEGIRIPPTRLVRDGVIDTGVLNLIAHNTREPEDRILDLKVQLATNEGGVRNVLALIETQGLEVTLGAVQDLFTYTARRFSARVARLADGVYEGRSAMDDDGAGGAPVPIVVQATVDGDRLSFDFAGTGPQSRGAFNVMPSGVMATVAYAVKALLDPDLPPNSGLFDAIELSVPDGSILNPRFPGAVGARTTTCQKLSGAMFAAFEALLPKERVMAASHDVLAAMVFAGYSPRRAGAYVYLETVGGGIGGAGDADGMDGAHVHITNSLNMPIESVELEYPLQVEHYALIPDSGGAGEFRGGLGISREVRILEDGTTFSARADGFKNVADGVDGGLAGSNCRVVRNGANNAREVLDPKQRLLHLSQGETIRIETPGGAGIGQPNKRSPARLGEDLRDGKVTEEIARRDYGADLVERALRASALDDGTRP